MSEPRALNAPLDARAEKVDEDLALLVETAIAGNPRPPAPATPQPSRWRSNVGPFLNVR